MVKRRLLTIIRWQPALASAIVNGFCELCSFLYLPIRLTKDPDNFLLNGPFPVRPRTSSNHPFPGANNRRRIRRSAAC
jgi:hypothetical protein